MLPAFQKYTSVADGRVTLCIESGADNTPVSVPGLLSKAAQECGDLPALNYKSNNKWVKVTYKYDCYFSMSLEENFLLMVVFIL